MKCMLYQGRSKHSKLAWGAVSLVLCVGLLLPLTSCGQLGSETSGGHIELPASTIGGDQPGQIVPNQEEIQRQGYAVSSCSEYATGVAAQILEAGGNAADAAVALSYTLAVVEPYASGLGGGGCMVIYDPDTDQYVSYNYAAEAPQSGASNTILVPGFVSGMDAVLSDYGTMTLAELLQPAIGYCDGVEVNATLATRIDAASGSLAKYSDFLKDGNLLSTGDVLVQQKLKETLEILAEDGPDAFYTGKIAEEIAASTPLTMDDLANYETIRTDAVTGSYLGYTVAAMPAPFSGATLIQALEMAEMLDIPSPEEDTQGFLEQLRQITAAAHSDRIKNIFDPRFGTPSVSQSEMVSEAYIASLLQLDPEEYEDEEESEDTTAFTIVDRNGLVVSCTNTLSSFFGSKVAAAGFFMNNSGRNFGSGVNAYEPGKRPRTHIAPAILRSEDEVIAVATPGGNVIIKVLSSVLMDIFQFGTPAEEAIAKQRLIFKTSSMIYFEVGYDTPLLASVSKSGYSTVPYNSHSYFGNIAYSSYSGTEGFWACTDVRREGKGAFSNE